MGRALRKTHQFLTQAHQASQQVPRLLEAIAGAEWVLVRSPELGMAVQGTGYSSWPIHPTGGASFKIIYTFDSREVVLHALYTAIPPGSLRRT